MWLRREQDIRKQVKGWIFDSASRRDHFKCTQTCRREREKREIKNLWHHVQRMSAMSLQTTSQHIRVRVRITSRPVTAVQEREELLWNAIEREVRRGMTGQWASSLYITWRNPTNGSEIGLCCQNFHLKGGKKDDERAMERNQGGTRGRQWEKEREFVRGRKHRVMCFTAYLRLGHYGYRRDIKQIRSGMTWSAQGTGLQWKHMAFSSMHKSTNRPATRLGKREIKDEKQIQVKVKHWLKVIDEHKKFNLDLFWNFLSGKGNMQKR